MKNDRKLEPYDVFAVPAGDTNYVPSAFEEEGPAAQEYGVPATLGLLPGRVTFVIDKNGVVQRTFNSQFQATKHVSEAIATLRTL